jgi:hypothetical protein
VKVASNGDEQWDTTYGYGTTGLSKVRAIKQKSDGGYLVCGYTHLLSVSSLGHEQWNVALEGLGRTIEIISDGEYYVGGYQGTSAKVPFVTRYRMNAAVRPGVTGAEVLWRLEGFGVAALG